LRRTLWDDGYRRFDVLGGYQFTRMDDSIFIEATEIAVNEPPLVPGTFSRLRESFQTQDEFHGASLGFAADWRQNVWSLELLGKVGLGDMRQSVTIAGQSAQTPPGGPTTMAPIGVVFARPTNIGTYERHRFAAVPELNVNGVYNINPRFRLLAGYSIMYWSNVVLAGNQIDPRVNPTQLVPPFVGPRRPLFAFHRNDFVVQGLNLGLDCRW
jgi:hypothetical protein